MIWIVAVPLWIIAGCLLRLINFKKAALQMVDVDRASVYKTHLGEKLSKKQAPLPLTGPAARGELRWGSATPLPLSVPGSVDARKVENG
jgi:hypothetical protein